jgi:hypothetical protein
LQIEIRTKSRKRIKKKGQRIEKREINKSRFTYDKGVVERRVDVGNAEHLLAGLQTLRAVVDLGLLDLNSLIAFDGGSLSLLAL